MKREQPNVMPVHGGLRFPVWVIFIPNIKAEETSSFVTESQRSSRVSALVVISGFIYLSFQSPADETKSVNSELNLSLCVRRDGREADGEVPQTLCYDGIFIHSPNQSLSSNKGKIWKQGGRVYTHTVSVCIRTIRL